MLTVCGVNAMFYNNKWKSSEKAAAVSLFQGEESADADALRENGLESIEVLVSTYFQAGTSVTLTRASKVLCVTLPWSAADLRQAISRVHRLSKTGPSLSVKLFSSNAILDMANVNRHAKRTLLTTYNNKYAENTEVIDLTDLRDDELPEENDFDEVDDGI